MSDSASRGAPAAGAPLAPPLLVAIVMAAGLALSWYLPLALPRGASAALLALFPALTATALAATAMVALRRADTAILPWDPTTQIVTGGPYRFTRNPIYLAFLLVQVSFAFGLSNGWWLVLLPLSWYLLDVVQVRREERYLVKTFGETYLAYARRVRRWI